MKPNIYVFIGILLFSTVLQVSPLIYEVGKLTRENTELRDKLDWWECERMPELPQEPTLVE